MQIVGYAKDWRVKAGGRVSVHVSTSFPTYYVRLVRLLGPIESPGDWIDRTEVTEAGLAGPRPGTQYPLRLGSYMIAQCARTDDSPFELRLCVRVGASRNGDTLAELQLERAVLRVDLSENGHLRLVSAEPPGAERSSVGESALPLNRWCRVVLHVDARACQVALSATHVEGGDRDAVVEAELTISAWAGRLSCLILAGRSQMGGVQGSFDGKIEAPLLVSGNDAADHQSREIIEAHWDLSRQPYDDECIPDVTGRQPPAQLVNGPARGVTSSDWRGQVADYREAPDLYAAAAFHRDDLDDAAWPEGFSFDIPANARSGAYAVILSGGEMPDWNNLSSFWPTPLFIMPLGPTDARVALLLPTFSYRAYANSAAYDEVDPAVFLLRRETASKPVYEYVQRAGLKSVYDVHPDGSGVHLASMLRPQATVRPDFVSMLLGAPHQFSADLNILAWLEQLCVAYDVLTDEEAHERGGDALGRYDVVVSGSHPEYASPELLDALGKYFDTGGSLMYLGGNGFYWSVGIDRARPWRLEVRRSEGVRTWSAAPGERRHQTDGRPGGLWRALGRPPNLLVGVGFSSHGFSGDGCYRVSPDLPLKRLPPRLGAIMANMVDRAFGVAGLELDSYDIALGSPTDAIVLARSCDLPQGYMPAVEEIAALDALLPDPMSALSRASRGDIVLSRKSGRGLCFSIGSIRWTSGLADASDRLGVRAITTAALLDILDDARDRRELARRLPLSSSSDDTENHSPQSES